MLIGAALVLCLLSVPLAGGRLLALASLRFRLGWVIALALTLQIVVIKIMPGGPEHVNTAAHSASYVLAAAFVWANRRVPGLPLIALGGGLNALAMALNGGLMPAAADAQAAAGIVDEPGQWSNSVALEDPRLGFLGDVFAVPASWPLANVFSVGDILLVAGALVLMHGVAASCLAGRRRWGFERVPAGADAVLLRVARPRGAAGAELVVAAGDFEKHLAPLPGSGASGVGYALPRALSMRRELRYWLELDGRRFALPAPLALRR